MFREKKSLFARLTGIINNHQKYDDFEEEAEEETIAQESPQGRQVRAQEEEEWAEEENSEGQLSVDLYHTPTEIVLQAMVAGVRPDDLEISITREMVTIRGKRDRARSITHDNYFFQELYWGAFSRTVVLPEEIDVEEAEASSQHGFLTIRLPKIDKKKTQKLKVKSG